MSKIKEVKIHKKKITKTRDTGTRVLFFNIIYLIIPQFRIQPREPILKYRQTELLVLLII
jgi:hypothetical protein